MVTRNGQKILSHTGENLVVDTGLEYVSAYIVTSVNTSTTGVTWPMQYMAIGSGLVAEAATNTALINENMRKAATLVTTQYLGVYESMRAVATFFNFSGVIAEYGLFNASTGSTGVMWARDSEFRINLTAGDTMTVWADFFFVGT